MRLQERVTRLEGVGRNDAPTALIVFAGETVDEALARELATHGPSWSPVVVLPAKQERQEEDQ